MDDRVPLISGLVETGLLLDLVRRVKKKLLDISCLVTSNVDKLVIMSSSLKARYGALAAARMTAITKALGQDGEIAAARANRQGIKTREIGTNRL